MLPLAYIIQRASVKCKQPPVYGVFDRYFHIPLPIVTKHELGLPFPPRNLPIKFGTNPSTVYLVIVVTDIHTDTHTDHKPTPVKTLPRFRADNKRPKGLLQVAKK